MDYEFMEKSTLNMEPVTPIEETITEVIPEEKPEEKPVVKEEPVKVTGIISGCDKLNVRKSPNLKAERITIVSKGDKVTIDKKKSNKNWYRITTASGSYGYCMREYVTVESE